MTERDARAVGAGIDALLEELGSSADPRAARTAEELVRLLMEFYGAGLERVTAVLGAAPNGDELLRELTGDRLVASQLILHGLHPLDVDARVHQALDGVRPYLGSHAGGVEYLGVDDEGRARLRLEGSCNGCPSSTITVKLAIERAIEELAPELAGVAVEGMVDEPALGPRLVQIESITAENGGAHLDGNGHAHENGGATGDWLTFEGLDALRPGQMTVVQAGSARVVVCASADGLYAYRDACPGCGSAALETGRLLGHELVCPTCERRYDVRLAGRNVGDESLHLDPLPLLPGDAGVRIAVVAGGAA